MKKNRLYLHIHNLSLRKKIAGLTMTATIFALIIGALTLGTISRRTLIKKNQEQIEHNMIVISDRVNSIISDAKLCTNNLTLSINNIEETKKDSFDHYTSIMSALNSSVMIFDGIDSIVFVDTDGKIYYTGYDLFSKQGAIRNSIYLDLIKDQKKGVSLLFDLEDDCMFRQPDRPVITMAKHIYDMNTKETLGYVFVNISVDHLVSATSEETTQYFFFDSKGTCINASEDETLNSLLDQYVESESDHPFLISASKSNYLVSSSPMSEEGWDIIGVTDLDAYNISTLQFIRVIIIFVLAFFVFLIILNNIITKILTTPLEQLMKGAEEIGKGNLDTKFDFDSQDEIGRMGHVFNEMTTELSSLLVKIDEEAKAKRHYELSLIQEQLKPHFLYNSLDIILVLIEMGKSKDAIRATRKLAAYYKNSLSSSAEIIPLEREFQILEDYLDLQLIRYQDQFKYDLSLPNDLAQIMLPKMTLQPLVENALYHGLKLKEGWGTIHVKAVLASENTLLLTVSDDGIGMTKSTLEQLKELQKDPKNHFGVYSVSHRLQLYYGDKFRMEIESTYYEGTTFFIYIPLEISEGEANA